MNIEFTFEGHNMLITTEREESSYGQPVVVVDGEITDIIPVVDGVRRAIPTDPENPYEKLTADIKNLLRDPGILDQLKAIEMSRNWGSIRNRLDEE